MKFLLITYLDEQAWLKLSESEKRAAIAECAPHVEKLRAAGKFLEGAPLRPTSEGRTLRLRKGKPLVTDGPFAETREQIAGYTLINAADIGEAERIAAGFLGNRGLAIIEVRALAET